MGDYKFIYENSNTQKIRVFLFTFFIVLVLGIIILTFREPLYNSAQNASIFKSIISLAKLQLTELTPAGLFYAAMIGGLFFVLMPLEVIFYGSVVKGSDPVFSVIMMTLGFITAQVINYYLGLKLSPLLMFFVSKKKVYETRRFINKYGGYGVFLLNVSPLPAEILTFALGITKYNAIRLFTIGGTGTLLKYIGIAIIALFFQ